MIPMRAARATSFVLATMGEESIVMKFPEQVSPNYIRKVLKQIRAEFGDRFKAFGKHLDIWKEEGNFLCIEIKHMGGGNRLEQLEQQARWRLDNPRHTVRDNRRRALSGSHCGY